MWLNLAVRFVLMVILLLGVGGRVYNATDRIPTFEEFAAKPLFQGSPARPRFTNPPQLRPNRQVNEKDMFPDEDDRYRASVEYDAERGPNFAAQYTIARWSCGTSCFSMVVIETGTGTLYRNMPFGTLVTNGNPGATNHKYAGLTFRRDSSLLIIEGCFDMDYRDSQGKAPDCSRSYYRWVRPRFQLL